MAFFRAGKALACLSDFWKPSQGAVNSYLLIIYTTPAVVTYYPDVDLPEGLLIALKLSWIFWQTSPFAKAPFINY